MMEVEDSNEMVDVKNTKSRHELHPMHNPDELNPPYHFARQILEHIFSFCEPRYLKVFRLVSNVWWFSSLSAWRVSTRVCLSPNQTIPKFLQFIEDSQFLRMPFSNYYIFGKYQPEFATRCGSFVNILELEEIEFVSADILRNIIFQCCPNMGQLSLVKVHVKGLSDDEDEEESNELMESQFHENRNLKSLTLNKTHLKIGWMQILSHYPCLKKISLVNYIDFDAEGAGGLFRAIITVRKQHPGKLKLIHVDTKDLYLGVRNFRSDFTNFLLDRTLQLQTLCINPSQICYNDRFSLEKILGTHSASLKMLVMNGGSNSSWAFDEEFPVPDQRQLEKLKELMIWYTVLPSLRILMLTSNLRKLALIHVRGDIVRRGWNMDADMSQVQLNNCKELEFLYYNYFGDEDLLRLMGWLPNVEILKMSLENEHFPLVCEHWTNLKSLTMVSAEVDDYKITGLDGVDVNRINGGGDDFEWRPITVPRANITCLKELARLHLYGKDPWKLGSTVLGRCAVVCGIERLANLKQLRIENYTLQPKKLWDRMFTQYIWPEDR